MIFRNDPFPNQKKKLSCLQAARCHLKFALGGENANPSVVVVGHHNVAVHVHGDAGRSLELPRRPAPDAEAHLELAVVGEDLKAVA